MTAPRPVSNRCGRFLTAFPTTHTWSSTKKSLWSTRSKYRSANSSSTISARSWKTGRSITWWSITWSRTTPLRSKPCACSTPRCRSWAMPKPFSHHQEQSLSSSLVIDLSIADYFLKNNIQSLPAQKHLFHINAILSNIYDSIILRKAFFSCIMCND